jgi:hypothetical protein
LVCGTTPCMIRGSRDIEEALLEHLGVKRNGLYIHAILRIQICYHKLFRARSSFAVSVMYLTIFFFIYRGDKRWFIFCRGNGMHGNNDLKYLF